MVMEGACVSASMGAAAALATGRWLAANPPAIAMLSDKAAMIRTNLVGEFMRSPFLLWKGTEGSRRLAITKGAARFQGMHVPRGRSGGTLLFSGSNTVF